MLGTVYKSTGSWYLIRDEENNFRNIRLRGKLKIEDGVSSTNPIAVGDRVKFTLEDQESGVITEVLPRDNYIIRESPHNRNQRHVVAANIDRLLIIGTITSPRTSQGFIDRILITAEMYHIPTLVLINKIDLLQAKHEKQLQDWKKMYEAAGYAVYPVSALSVIDIEQLKKELQGKTTLLMGHSGSGKSTIINQLIPGLKIRTADISRSSGKGQHTTTFATMYDLPDGGRIIDTPGMKEFGLMDIEKSELAHYFPEIRTLISDCRFHNCLHADEPDCAVKQAIEDGKLSMDRYLSYRMILDSLAEKW